MFLFLAVTYGGIDTVIGILDFVWGGAGKTKHKTKTGEISPRLFYMRGRYLPEAAPSYTLKEPSFSLRHGRGNHCRQVREEEEC